MSGSRNGGSSLEGEDSEVESMGSLVLRNPQWGFTGECYDLPPVTFMHYPFP